MTGQRTVLVVDDEPHIRLLIATVLSGRGCEVAAAADGREALHLVRTLSPDLILLDWAMPGMNGGEFLTLLDEGQRSIPVMVITGSANPASLNADRRVADYLAKPFDVWVLADRVERLLDRAPRQEGRGPVTNSGA